MVVWGLVLVVMGLDLGFGRIGLELCWCDGGDRIEFGCWVRLAGSVLVQRWQWSWV